MKSSASVILLLDNIRSAHNVGSIFRTADTIGAQEIILSGVTPCPIDRFGRVVKEIAKTALGAEKVIPWRHVAYTKDILFELKEQGYHIIALEQSPRSIDYKSFSIQKPIVLVVGNEVEGIDEAVLTIAETIIEIPQRGKKESLNVAVATAIALFRILDN